MEHPLRRTINIPPSRLHHNSRPRSRLNKNPPIGNHNIQHPIPHPNTQRSTFKGEHIMEELTTAYLETVAQALSQSFVTMKDFKVLQQQQENLSSLFLVVVLFSIILFGLTFFLIHKQRKQIQSLEQQVESITKDNHI